VCGPDCEQNCFGEWRGGLFETSMRPISHASPLRLLIIVSASVFLAEAVIMVLLSVAHLGPLQAILLDSALLVILVLPALRFFVMRPLEAHIAERKRAEASLAESKMMLERLFAATDILVAFVDLEFNFVSVNRAYAEAHGKTAGEIIGQNYFDLFPDPENERIFRQVLETGEAYVGYARPSEHNLAPDSGLSYWDWRLLPVQGSDGHMEGLLLALADVTSPKMAEMALAESEALLRKVLESLPVSVRVLDRKGRIVQANPASDQLWGRAPALSTEDHAEIKGRLLDTDTMLDARDWPSARAILNGETVLEKEIAIESAGGTRKIVLESAVPLNTPSGGVIVVSEDITERKQAERRIQQRNRELATLHAISTHTSGLLETRELLYCVKDLLIRQAGFSAGRIFRYSAAARELELELSWEVGETGQPRGARVSSELYPFCEVLSEKKVLILKEDQTDSMRKTRGSSEWLLPGSGGSVWVPLLANGEIQGVIALANENSAREADPARLGYFQAMGQIMGVAIHNSWLFAREQKARQTAEVLRQACLDLTQSLDMGAVMEALLDFTARLVPYDTAFLILVEDDEHLAIHAARGCRWEERLRRGERVSLDRGEDNPVEQAIACGRGRITATLAPDSIWKRNCPDLDAQSWLQAPLVAGRKVIGVLCLGKEQPGFYTDEHLLLAEALAGQAAVALQNAWLFGQLQASRERLHTLSRQLVEVQENERGYVARELHDEAGQVLTSLMVGLRLLERDAQDPKAIGAGIARLKRMVDDVLENLHRLAMDLRPASLDHLGLGAALRQQVEAIADQNSLTAQMETIGLDERLPKDIEIALYRIVQEALANVVRHSMATRVDVVLERRAGKVVAIVEDNGVGFKEQDAVNSCRLGLFGMRERAEMLGGSLTVECGTTGGTTILVEVPYGN